eukprot:TRINITY_DN1409_c0_g2_i1.p1 TRINITY_DN1409_c0_g2~~TRINITY_DN1409_c0_g2_i1.p1  ORF type:complete len:1959 (-),score=798.60 TRINITY_DN1409_c0_g2_i1:751-6627(-)
MNVFHLNETYSSTSSNPSDSTFFSPKTDTSSNGSEDMNSELPAWSEEPFVSEVLYHGKQSLVYRIQKPIKAIIKSASQGYPGPKLWKKYQRELFFGNHLRKRQNQYVLEYLGIQKLRPGHGILMKDYQLISLHLFQQKNPNLELNFFLRLAIELITGLGKIHKDGIVHQAIRPSHILINANAMESIDSSLFCIKFIDFSTAFSVQKNSEGELISSKLRQKLNHIWISPEQTGRISKRVDYRTDFYSLGLVFYWLLCGEPPFKEEGGQDLDYAHIAKTPKPIQELNPKVPQCLSQIVLKLLSKDADQRYQSVYGILQDLKKININSLPQNFVAGKEDVSPNFRIIPKLYGREKEIKTLLRSFEKISSGQVQKSFVLVSGYSGIGKTALITELNKPLSKGNGYMLFGKVDQFNRGLPYGSILQAFRQFICNLLTQSVEKVEYWKEKILNSLSGKGRVITDVIPELIVIIGNQPNVPEVGPAESQNRFKQVFLQFVAALAQPQHPLVLFLDDLQWADIPTLFLLESILLDTNISHLMVVSAYRDNEVNEAHPLILTINNIRESMKVSQLFLNNLELGHISQLVSDTLHCNPKESEQLSDLILKRTKGNPFFVAMFLTNLHRENLLHFSSENGKWMWDIHKIEKLNATDNVVELMTKRIRDFDSSTQKVIAFAAAIGNKFNINTLALVCKDTIENTSDHLWNAIRDSLLLVSGSEEKLENPKQVKDWKKITFQFLHDKVQQAAYENIPVENRERVHLDIARLLIADNAEDLFEIASHLLLAHNLIETKEEKIKIADTLLHCSQVAKKSSAFQPSNDYAKTGLRLLSEESWNDNYKLILDLNKMKVETEYLRGNYEEALEMYDFILEKCQSDFDKVTVYQLMMYQYELKSRFLDIYIVARKCLALFGLEIPDINASDEEMIPIVKRLEDDIKGKVDIMDSTDFGEATDLISKKKQELLVLLWSPTFCLGKDYHMTLVCGTATMLSFNQGYSEFTPVAFSSYSYCCKDTRIAYKIGDTGIRLLDDFPNAPMKGRALCGFGLNGFNFGKPMQQGFLIHDLAMTTCLEQGDLPWAAYASHGKFTSRWYAGMELQKINLVYAQVINFLRAAKNPFMVNFSQAEAYPFLYHLKIQEIEKESFWKETELWPVCRFIMRRSQLECLFWEDSKDWSLLLESCDFVAKNTQGSLGFWIFREIKFIIAMIYLDSLAEGILDSMEIQESKPAYAKEVCMQRIEEGFKEFEGLMQTCPGNAEHKLFLMKGQRARADGNIIQAAKFFDYARISARDNGFIHYEAKACELLGKLWDREDLSISARPHFEQAHYLYSIWGSIAKTSQLQRQYPQYTGEMPEMPTRDNEERRGSEEIDEGRKSDMKAMMKITEAVSMDMNLEQLLDTMMKVLIESSGASRGILVLAEGSKQEELTVVAEGDTDRLQVDTIRAIPLDSFVGSFVGIINYVARTKDTIISSSVDSKVSQLLGESAPSVLCIPVKKNGEYKGVVYLENNMITDAFNEQRARVVGMITSQMVTHLDNAKFSQLLASEKRYRALSVELSGVQKRLEEFIDVLCHELRNPINGIYASKQLMFDFLVAMEDNMGLMTDSNLKEILIKNIIDVKEMMDAVSISADHLKEIVDTVLTVSMLEKQQIRLESTQFKPAEMIKNVIAMYKAKFQQKGLFIKVDLEESEDVYLGDSHRITQVIINLISNSVKFTETGGINIWMRAEEREGDKVALRFKISDTGIGMTEEETHKLFHRFTQANSFTYSRYGGSGLGLQISKEIVKALGGDISAQSKQGEGTTFEFHVICEKSKENGHAKKRKLSIFEEEEPSSKFPALENHPDSHRFKILVVEDNIINQKLLKKILENEGFQVDVANNGKEAVDKVTCLSDHEYQVIFMDMEMPVMNGLQATKMIRQYEVDNPKLLQVKIVGVSANARDIYSAQSMEMGMNDYITKPYQKRDILSAIPSWKGQ